MFHFYVNRKHGISTGLVFLRGAGVSGLFLLPIKSAEEQIVIRSSSLSVATLCVGTADKVHPGLAVCLIDNPTHPLTSP